ncbi:MAG: hypothetical protein J5518_08555 [Lachnospiraceae bacterium]|nr:hypothetical protein [Lachnospiraceae bacterium]
MTNRYQRRQQMKNAHITAMVVGIFIALCGLYFIFGISRQTDTKNAKCTEVTTGVVTEVVPSGSKYRATIDYAIEDIDKTMTIETKKDPGVGTQIEIKYEPLHFSHLYIEGVSSTGKDNMVTGGIMILAGAAFFGLGLLMKKMKKKKREMNDMEES